ncbi:YihY/virulence factor BrkB family protein [Planosporangium sp. 12N6]|uniref:YihY/virulence factor BrkB family protein n=1 Tax=Planosporangium spinosum TaxID=3402278 RepID=UPI003CE85D73
MLKRTFKQFQVDNLGDWAAALTYYGVLSLFPGLLALVSSLGLLGPSATNTVIDTLQEFMPPTAKPIIDPAVRNLQHAPTGLLAIVGVLGALWSASGYIGAFMRASNAIYDVPEGRPFWKTLPLRVGLTIMIGTLMVVSAFIVVFTGKLAEIVGRALHLGQTAITVWSIAKWPVLLVLVSLAFALLYYLAPNAKQTGFRWITPGGLLAVLIWVVASAAFGVYAANFSSYNKTYGTLGGVIAALVWLWISNIAILLGAEFDAELERARAIQGGMRPEDQEPYLPLRDDRKVPDDDVSARRKNNGLA